MANRTKFAEEYRILRHALKYEGGRFPQPDIRTAVNLRHRLNKARAYMREQNDTTIFDRFTISIELNTVVIRKAFSDYMRMVTPDGEVIHIPMGNINADDELARLDRELLGSKRPEPQPIPKQGEEPFKIDFDMLAEEAGLHAPIPTEPIIPTPEEVAAYPFTPTRIEATLPLAEGLKVAHERAMAAMTRAKARNPSQEGRPFFDGGDHIPNAPTELELARDAEIDKLPPEEQAAARRHIKYTTIEEALADASVKAKEPPDDQP